MCTTRLPWSPLLERPVRVAVARAFAASVALTTVTPVHAACARPYSVAIADTGTYAYIADGSIKGLLPVVFDELTRRTQCRFEMRYMPRARMWLEWAAGSIDIVAGSVQTEERDANGSFSEFGGSPEMLISAIAPPSDTLVSWLDLPQHPVLGRLRSAVYGGDLDKVSAMPRYASQMDEAVDDSALIRKLFAGRVTGIVMASESFGLLCTKLGFDAATMKPYAVRERPRVPLGIYLRKPQLVAADQLLLASTLDAMLKSGFNATAYVGVLAEAASAGALSPKK